MENILDYEIDDTIEEEVLAEFYEILRLQLKLYRIPMYKVNKIRNILSVTESIE